MGCKLIMPLFQYFSDTRLGYLDIFFILYSQIWEGTPIRVYEIGGRFKLVDGKFSQ